MEGPGDTAPRPRELHHPDYLADGVYQALDLTVGLFRGRAHVVNPASAQKVSDDDCEVRRRFLNRDCGYCSRGDQCAASDLDEFGIHKELSFDSHEIAKNRFCLLSPEQFQIVRTPTKGSEPMREMHLLAVLVLDEFKDVTTFPTPDSRLVMEFHFTS